MRHWLQAEQELSASREGSSQLGAASSPTGQGAGSGATTATTARATGNGAPQNGTVTAANSDVRPLQGTRAAAAAARDPKRQPGVQPPAEKSATPPGITTGRRK